LGRVLKGGPAGLSGQAGQPVGDTALNQHLRYGISE
jgi:hypothetical protein